MLPIMVLFDKQIERLGVSDNSLNEILDFCMGEGLLYKGDSDRVFVSRKGFVHYGALFSLFYPTQFGQKASLIALERG